MEKSYSIVRLNSSEKGWGVIDDATGALVHIDGLALRLSKENAQTIAKNLNFGQPGDAPDTPD